MSETNGDNIAATASRIMDDITAAKEKKFRRVRPTSLWASSVGHPCPRSLYYNVAEWEQRMPPRPGLQALFDQGHIEAVASRRDIEEAGFEIVRQEEHFVINLRGGKHRTITGKIDWFITGSWLGRRQVACEHKGYSYGNAEKWTDWHEMLDAPQPWIRSVPAQMQCYLYGLNQEAGVLGLRGKESGQLNFLPMELDMGYTEATLQKAETVYDALDAGKPPDRMEYEPAVCDRCDFLEMCNPATVWASGDIITDEKFLALLRRRSELQATAKVHKGVDAEAKAYLARIEDDRERVCGEFTIQRKKNKAGVWTTKIKEAKPV